MRASCLCGDYSIIFLEGAAKKVRFNSKTVRCLASFSYVIRSLLNLAVTVFTPCVALKTVIGLPHWASIIGITTISVLFTSMGGLKAAITSDVIQGFIVIGISLVIIGQGVYDVGGISPMLNVTSERGRFDFFDFNMDPTIRVTTVSATLGQLFMSLSVFGCQQNFVQRYCSMSSRGKVATTMMANMPVITVLLSLSWVVGIVIFASYADCDPLSMGYTSKFDEIVPFYVKDRLAYLPGLMGLIMATLFNSALTLAVSNLNSLATVTFEDFLSQIPALSSLRDTQQLRLIRIIGVVYGLVIVGVSFLVAMLSGVIESSMLMTSATSGPLLGVFVLAMLVPCCNWKGAAAGMIFSHVTTLWITFGHLSVAIDAEPLPLSTAGCRNDTFAPYLVTPSPAPGSPTRTPLQFLYGITYMYYALVGSVTTIIVGIIVSLVTADAKEDAYAEHLLHPVALKLSKWCPGEPRSYVARTRLADPLATTNPSYTDSDTSVTHETGEPEPELGAAEVGKLNAFENVPLGIGYETNKGSSA
ncbi:sodium-coupled monocarboxylate transporter 2-like isoform X2 [Venturia canescens]|uniref:sodium-coupled monocarboxylate transporter 2-like isoform X2 n=1 Tax=Venturia canescens TaxID=32260 RepID=UPI001C9D5DE3|nr:sodium-coupled monocarboxylate transporter 2-like isoform X2 [Venturia canescens]